MTFTNGDPGGLPDRLAAAGSRHGSGREGILRDPHPGPVVRPESGQSCIELGRSFDDAANRLIERGMRSGNSRRITVCLGG